MTIEQKGTTGPAGDTGRIATFVKQQGIALKGYCLPLVTMVDGCGSIVMGHNARDQLAESKGCTPVQAMVMC